jgi:heme/copper-type cytochrome/quinol oxidase subunit 4
MTETKEKPELDVMETNSQPSERKNSGNTLLTIKLMIIASVVLGVIWVLDSLLAK